MAARFHVVWVHSEARWGGGAERYIGETALLMRSEGVRSTLLYDVESAVDPRMAECFEGLFPLVRPADQIASLAPDLVFVQRAAGRAQAEALATAGPTAVRFFHDHRLFCLRQHKYTTLTQQTCTRTVGPGCYPCLGFLNRSERWPGLRLASVGGLLAEQRANRSFSAFVVGSHYMAEHAAAHGFPRERIHVCPLYATPPPAKGATPREADRLLFVGALNRGKGLDVLLRALAASHARPRLWVAGRGRQEAELRALAHRLHLGQRVDFLGALPKDELHRLYGRASVVVVPSREPETFGLVGVEAMSHATPVVASRAGGITEWLEDGKTGLSVAPGDPPSLAAAIDRLLGDPKLRDALGAASLRAHRERFLPAHHVRRLLDLFSRLTGREI